MNRWARALTILLAGVLGAPGLASAQQASTVIVMDGSGSMAGWLRGAKNSKFDMALTALEPALSELAPETSLGLVGFGHRRKRDCTDVQVRVAPAEGSLGAAAESLKDMRTVGKGPMVEAMRQAEGLLKDAAKRSMIVIHDNADNCRQDACETAKAMVERSPGLTVHVITVGDDPKARSAMACVPETTGGKYYQVTDAEGISAAVSDVIKLAVLPPAPSPTPAIRPDTPEDKLAEAGLILTASLTDGTGAINAPVEWTINKDGEDRPVYSESAAEVVKALPAGSYSVQARLGLAEARQTIAVDDGKPSVARLNLKAGRLILPAIPGGQDDALLTITKSGEENEPVYVGRRVAGALFASEGAYILRVDRGVSQSAHEVSVEAGKDVKIPASSNLGGLTLAARSSQEGPAVRSVLFTISEDDPDSPGGRREVARSAAPNPSFALPAGTYYVTARAKQAEANERIAVSAGATLDKTVILALARLSVSASTSEAISGTQADLDVRIISVGGQEKEMARSSEKSPSFTLPSGQYRVEARLGSENAMAAADASLQAGGDTQVDLKIAAGRVELVRRSGGRKDDIIEVLDTDGQVVWHAGGGDTSSALLAPGSYTYRLPDGSSASFTVKNGERLTLKVSEP